MLCGCQPVADSSWPRLAPLDLRSSLTIISVLLRFADMMTSRLNASAGRKGSHHQTPGRSLDQVRAGDDWRLKSSPHSDSDALFAIEVQSILAAIQTCSAAPFRPRRMTGIDPKGSFKLVAANVGYGIANKPLRFVCCKLRKHRPIELMKVIAKGASF